MKRTGFFLVVLVLLACGCSSAPRQKTTLIWLSIDGMRYDYLDRIKPPALSKLAQEGAYTKNQKSIFPSMTFPNHAAQVTGTSVDKHGIPLNNFYDSQTHQSYALPDDSSLLRAESIWITATRQNVRTLVWDWPLSHQIRGDVRPAISAEKYDRKATDEQRLQHVAELAQNDPGAADLRLVISYLAKVDVAGHKFGPDSPEVAQAVLNADKEVDAFLSRMIAWFDATHSKDEELVVFLSTDHGMADVLVRVNFEKSIGAELNRDVKFISSGPTGHVYLDAIPKEQRAARTEAILGKLKQIPGAHAWLSKNVPPEYHYADPTRLGEIVVTLGNGVTWASRLEGASGTKPTTTQSTTRSTASPKGAHGWDPDTNPDMRGLSIIWRYRQKIGGKELGEIQNTQWYATACKVLGINPSRDAETKAIVIP